MPPSGAASSVVQVDTTVSCTTATTTVSYDAKVNITNKSDVGSFTHGQADANFSSGHPGAHAVTVIVG